MILREYEELENSTWEDFFQLNRDQAIKLYKRYCKDIKRRSQEAFKQIDRTQKMLKKIKNIELLLNKLNEILHHIKETKRMVYATYEDRFYALHPNIPKELETIYNMGNLISGLGKVLNKINTHLRGDKSNQLGVNLFLKYYYDSRIINSKVGRFLPFFNPLNYISKKRRRNLTYEEYMAKLRRLLLNTQEVHRELKANLEITEDDFKLIQNSLKHIYFIANHVSKNKGIFGEGPTTQILSLLNELYSKFEELGKDENFYKVTEIKIIKIYNRVNRLLSDMSKII